MIRRQLPFLLGIRIGKTEVQCRLTPIEIAHELSVALTITLDELSGKLSRGIHPVGFRPDVIV